MRPKLLILPWSLGCCIFFLALSRARGQGLPDPHVNHTDPIPGHAICENTCLGEAADGDNDSNNTVWLSDGICDDGGPGAYYTGCDWGTDCDDCDPRDGGFTHPPPNLLHHAHYPTVVPLAQTAISGGSATWASTSRAVQLLWPSPCPTAALACVGAGPPRWAR